MATPAIDPSSLRQDLRDRRGRLEQALDAVGPAPDLQRLLGDVDAALDRLEVGRLRLCAVCDEPLEDSLAHAPMASYCLCDLDAAQRRELEHDLESARGIQIGLLPAEDLRTEVWQTHYRYLPAGAVSGDIIDLAPDPDGAVRFLLGDVAGKGVAAALLMSHLVALFHSEACAEIGLDAIAARINGALVARTGPARYVTLVVGRAHPDGRVELVNAGHVPPLVVRRSGVTTCDSTGLPAGLFDDATYGTRETMLDPGESLVLFTDGLTEALAPTGEELGFAGVSEILAAHGGSDPRALAADALARVAVHQASSRQHDDQTLMVLQRR